jgi:hypothetical protein
LGFNAVAAAGGASGQDAKAVAKQQKLRALMELQREKQNFEKQQYREKNNFVRRLNTARNDLELLWKRKFSNWWEAQLRQGVLEQQQRQAGAPQGHAASTGSSIHGMLSSALSEANSEAMAVDNKEHAREWTEVHGRQRLEQLPSPEDEGTDVGRRGASQGLAVPSASDGAYSLRNELKKVNRILLAELAQVLYEGVDADDGGGQEGSGGGGRADAKTTAKMAADRVVDNICKWKGFNNGAYGADDAALLQDAAGLFIRLSRFLESIRKVGQARQHEHR